MKAARDRAEDAEVNPPMRADYRGIDHLHKPRHTHQS
jgi:hypothetical protein